MFVKLVLSLIVAVKISNGHPLEPPSYDVSKFFTSSRIVGGVDAPDGYAKHMVALVIHNHFMSFLVCGGSIISKLHVLTAAHCIEPFAYWDILIPDFIGVVGSNYWNSMESKVHFSGYTMHPNWDRHNIKNDIGILNAAKQITFNDKVGPIALDRNYIYESRQVLVTGWGLLGVWLDIPERLQLLYLRTLTPSECLKLLKNAQLEHGFSPPVDPAIEICTFHSVGKGMCNGDSGSALVDKKTKLLIGIVSWGFACAVGAPDMFTRTSAYSDFIKNATSAARP